MQDKAMAEEHKIMTMDASKRKRILNAAMLEFSKGYKAALTDEIAHGAGVSKGLLFHYFGTKEGLYRYILDYSLDRIAREYRDILHADNPDLLGRIWQLSLRKRELCSRHPSIFAFLTASYYQIEDDPQSDFAIRYRRLQGEIAGLLYDKIDEGLLRDGVDKVMASNVIRWTLDGLSDKMTQDKKPFHQMNEEFDRYLEETKGYLDLLRRMLYR